MVLDSIGSIGLFYLLQIGILFKLKNFVWIEFLSHSFWVVFFEEFLLFLLQGITSRVVIMEKVIKRFVSIDCSPHLALVLFLTFLSSWYSFLWEEWH